MSEFDIDEVMPHKEPVSNPVARSSRLSNADRRMGATAKELGLKPNTALVSLGLKAGQIKTGYDYKTGTVMGGAALTPSVKHFEDLHSYAVELEHHIQQHEHALNSTDMHPETRERAQNHINMAYATLANFHEHNSKAMTAHMFGEVPTGTLAAADVHTIGGAADHLTAAVDHLKSAYAASNNVAHPIISNIARKAADTVQQYHTDTNSAITERTASILRRADNVAESKTMGGAQRLPMLNQRERAQQQSEIAARRNVEPKTITGEEQQMMGRLPKRELPGPVPEGMVRTPSGGFAPEADVAAAHARQHAAQQEMVAKEQEKKAALQNVVRFTPRIQATTTRPIIEGSKGWSAPANKFAAMEIDKRNRRFAVDPARRAKFEAQQAQAKQATEAAGDSLIQSKLAKQSISERAKQSNLTEVQGHIDRGDLVSAAAAHFTFANPNVVVAPGAKIAKKHEKTVQEIKTNPIAYLSRQGFDVMGDSRGQAVREGRVRRERSIPAPAETRRPTTATTSAFTPQAETEYLEKLATADAQKAGRRSSPFKAGQNK